MKTFHQPFTHPKARTLGNAPIREAVIDLRCDVEGGEQDVLDSLWSMRKRLSEEFPEEGLVHSARVEVALDGESPKLRHDNALLGYALSSADQSRVVQLRRDGFTFSRLRPYPSWEQVATQAKSFWNIYTSGLKSVKVTRLGVRYVNEIEVPAGVALEDFFSEPPKAPRTRQPLRLESAIDRFVLSQPSTSVRAIVSRALSPVNGTSLVVFDIDVFLVVEGMDSKDDSIWDQIEQLRHAKNDIFFENLTDGCIGGYE